jgi:hypothetical protein
MKKNPDRNVVSWFSSHVVMVVTRNARDMQPSGVAIVDPWKPSENKYN